MIISSDTYPLEVKVEISNIEYEDRHLTYCIDRIWLEGVELENNSELYRKLETMLYEVDYLSDDAQALLESEALNRMIAQWEARKDGDR